MSIPDWSDYVMSGKLPNEIIPSETLADKASLIGFHTARSIVDAIQNQDITPVKKQDKEVEKALEIIAEAKRNGAKRVRIRLSKGASVKLKRVLAYTIDAEIQVGDSIEIEVEF